MYISYYRVSTGKQGKSGLGLASQKETVKSFVRDAKILNEYCDIETGKSDMRPQLNEALAECKTKGAILVIAKLDRLSRNMTFISTLMDSKVRFICCDMPDATELTIHIFAALAQWERKRISERTKDALKQLKERGIKLGNPNGWTDETQKQGNIVWSQKSRANENNIKAKKMINLLYKNGLKINKIIDELNDSGFKTSRGYRFKYESVNRLVDKVETIKK